MHEIEPNGFCTVKEYQRFIEKRKQAGEVSLGGLYLIIAALRGGIKGKEAFKFPIRMKLVDLGDMQVASLTVDILDLDLRPTEEAKFTMLDGISTNPPIMESSTTQRVTEMYIKDYEDYSTDGPGEVSIEDEISHFELVGV
jgi:hypothetical protein